MKKLLSLALALLAGTLANAQLTPVQPRPTTAALMAAGVDNTTFVTPFALANYPFSPLTGPYSPASFTANAVLLGGGTGAIAPSGISSTSGGTGFTGLATITAPASTDLTMNAGSGNQNVNLVNSGTGAVVVGKSIPSAVSGGGYTMVTHAGTNVNRFDAFSGSTFSTQYLNDAAGAYVNVFLNGGNLCLNPTSGNPVIIGGSTNNSNGVLQLASSTSSTAGIAWGADTTLYRTGANTLGFSGILSSYNSLMTAGLGVPVLVAFANITAQTAAATITSFANPATDADYEVGAQMSVTVSTTLVTTLTVTYTDVSNTSRTMILPVAQLAGSFIAAGAITGVGAWESPRMHIRAKASTTITILVASGTFTGVTFSASGTIAKFN